MDRIATEEKWLSCDEPYELAHYGRGCFDQQRFRWLAAEWGNRIRHIFEPDDLPWFDAFAAWVVGNGDHPSQVCQEPEYVRIDHARHVTSQARSCAESIRRDDPMFAAVFAAESASADFPFDDQNPVDFNKSHRPRAASKRRVAKAEEDAQREMWAADYQVHEKRIQQEFCTQFRDVAGNPFRPVAFRPAWLTSDVVGLASAIDATGYFDRLPILADALEEAGCTSEDVLRHCRDETTHVRGCWVIDNLLDRVKPVQV